VIYLTGGSARSPLIKKALAQQLPGSLSRVAMTSVLSPPVWPAGLTLFSAKPLAS
jgi:hypothetical protein